MSHVTDLVSLLLRHLARLAGLCLRSASSLLSVGLGCPSHLLCLLGRLFTLLNALGEGLSNFQVDLVAKKKVSSSCPRRATMELTVLAASLTFSVAVFATAGETCNDRATSTERRGKVVNNVERSIFG